MSTYKFLYMVGFTPWERMIESPAIRATDLRDVRS